MNTEQQQRIEQIRERRTGMAQFGPLSVGSTSGSHRSFVTVNGDVGLEANCGVVGERNNAKAEFFANAPADIDFLLSIVKGQEGDDVLIRREDAARAAELVNDSIKAKGKFAAAILMMPPYPAPDCPICGYPIDNTGLCVLDGTHTTAAPTVSYYNERWKL